MSRFRLGSILAAAAGILIISGGCAESPSAPVQAGASYELLRAPQGPSFDRSGSESRSQLIGPEGGVIELAVGRLVFPAGALAEPTEIGMRVDGEYQGVHLSPHGIQFPAHAQPVLELRAVGAGSERSDLTVVYVDDANQILEVLPTDAQGSRLTTSLEHFSGYLISTGRSR
ncbi:MAG TPA: hypothetical protein VLK84_17130 [Longimicrobium sp.]|nr:hypothetical protein [Longimicrobium sp.]